MAGEIQNPIIRVRDITVQFGATRVLDGLDLDVKRGEILGFVGPSGAGKSVLTRTIIGLVPKVAGSIEVFGVDLDASNTSQRRNVDLDAFQSIYDQAKGDDEIRKQVIFIYTQRREPAAVDKLMSIAKSDPDIEMRKAAIFWLGQKNDPRVKQFLRDLINK